MNPFKSLLVKSITGFLGVIVLALTAGDCAFFLITGDRLLIQTETTEVKDQETKIASKNPEISEENAFTEENNADIIYSEKELSSEVLEAPEEEKEPLAPEQLLAPAGNAGNMPEAEIENALLLPEPPDDGEPRFLLRVNRALNCITVYARDAEGEYTIPYKAIVCSTGRNNRTPLGNFALQERYRWRNMLGGVWSQYATRVYRGVMMHSVPYYTKNQGNLEVHQYNRLGEQASAGCIRMSTADAKWVFYFCEPGTPVEVYEDAEDPGPLGKPEPIHLEDDDPNYGWDPTDPDYPEE